jgi:hypothetical protein
VLESPMTWTTLDIAATPTIIPRSVFPRASVGASASN